MSMARSVAGRWVSGPHVGKRAVVSDVIAGAIQTTDLAGNHLFGSPNDYCADSGESGADLLDMLLPRPAERALFEGAVRESLAAANSLAILGRQDTRAWDRPDRYIVDDNEGGAAAVQFLSGASVGACRSGDASRMFDMSNAIAGAPDILRENLRLLGSLPLLSPNEKVGATAMFWSDCGILQSSEPWYMSYLFGGEVLRRELMDACSWADEAAGHYELRADLIDLISKVAKRATPLRPIVLTPHERVSLIPDDAEHGPAAIDEVLRGGLFRFG